MLKADWGLSGRSSVETAPPTVDGEDTGGDDEGWDLDFAALALLGVTAVLMTEEVGQGALPLLPTVCECLAWLLPLPCEFETRTLAIPTCHWDEKNHCINSIYV